MEHDQPLKTHRRRSSLGDCLKASSLLRRSSGLICEAPVEVAYEECVGEDPDLQDASTPDPVNAAPEPPTTDNDSSLPPGRQTRRDRIPTKLRHRTCSPGGVAIDATNVTTPKVFSICSFDTDLPPKAVQHRYRLRDWAESAHVLKGDNDTLRRAVKAMVTVGRKTSRLQEAAAHLWEAFRSGSNGKSATDQMEKARLFANLPLPLPDMQDDPAFEQIVNLQRTAALLYAQYAMVPHSVHSENPNNSDIILESSCIDQHVMCPWSDIDPDIRHDFFMDSPPEITVEEYFRSPLVSCVADSFHTGPKSESPTLVAPSAIPPVPGGPLGATTISGWDESGMWTDPHAGIQLAKKQLRKIHKWVRISELPEHRDAFSIARGKSQAAVEVCMFARKPSAWSIRQGFVGDCSFLSSLAALAEFDRRFDQANLTSLIYPRRPNRETGVCESTINPRGMYACRLFFNGVFRKVLIDDRVPIKENGKLLAAHSAHPGEMWVTLLEKAFIKLMGGSYYMRGSNPGADLFHLTGWIPETLPFRSDVQMGSPNNMSSMVTGGPMAQSARYKDDPFWLSAWQRLHNGHERGHCVACLGTTEVVDAAPFGLDFPEGVSVSSGVVAKHAYSVLRTAQINMGGRTLRLLFVKNPWGIVRWKGAFGPTDNTNWTKQLQDLLSYDQPSEAAMDNGTYWIQWHDVVFWFSHLYMCWNDQPYPHSSIVHTCWTVTPKMLSTSLADDSHLVAFNPQHCLELLPELSSLKKDSGEYARVLRQYGLTGSPREEVEVKVFFSRHV
ncbi:MAG: hypothetical protein KVP17_003012, partial [Porospora cf. gigantea B]|uniref:uncharacterized protein n=1 Tax=Porospora cf. gigantea B TaxID=2853592 RepID=UPI003571DA55